MPEKMTENDLLSKYATFSNKKKSILDIEASLAMGYFVDCFGKRVTKISKRYDVVISKSIENIKIMNSKKPDLSQTDMDPENGF